MTTLTYGEMRTKAEKRIDAELLARIKEGIEWLELEHGPGWEDKIQMEFFQISDPSCCVLGQVYADCADEADGNGYNYATDMMEMRGIEPGELGFDIDTPDSDWCELQQAWEIVLEERRG